jgi:hypothetical protein
VKEGEEEEREKREEEEEEEEEEGGLSLSIANRPPPYAISHSFINKVGGDRIDAVSGDPHARHDPERGRRAQ